MPEMIRILCEGLATVLFTLICTRFLCKNMKKRDFRFVPWLPYVLTGCGSAMLFLLGGLSPRTFCGIAFLFVLLYASVCSHFRVCICPERTKKTSGFPPRWSDFCMSIPTRKPSIFTLTVITPADEVQPVLLQSLGTDMMSDTFRRSSERTATIT